MHDHRARRCRVRDVLNLSAARAVRQVGSFLLSLVGGDSISARTCSKCQIKAKPIPVEYGLPDDSMSERAERGEVFLGGDFAADDGVRPRYVCPNCYTPVD